MGKGKKGYAGERVSSPEELNQYIRVSSSVVWIVLAAIIVLLVVAVVWGVFGTVDMVGDAGEAVPVHPITFIIN